MNNIQTLSQAGARTEVQKLPSASNASPAADAASLDTRQKTAAQFETAFIAQMLQFSGLDKALTTGGGAAVASFTQFYIEELAKDISNNGGFGIADKISEYMDMREEKNGELGKF